MGIIVLPFLLGALVIVGLSIKCLIDLQKTKEISRKELFLGITLSLLLFGLIVLSYLIEGKAWALSPAFRIPIFMVFIPFGIYLVTRASQNQRTKYFSTILLISIIITGTLGVIFNNLFFELIDSLGIEKHY